jgi:low affinity Fe/Cu permease
MSDEDRPPLSSIQTMFGHLAGWSAHAAGTWQAFGLAAAIVLLWSLGGFWFGFFDERYQLIINTLTTIVTFLMVFLIQHAANRDTAAIHAKLDALVKVSKASNELLALDQSTMEEIEAIREKTGAAEQKRRRVRS